ncbi:MAG: DUF3135 domain-containing protein [Proteobacteria bacterium]|jgi:hypothetical protein|nr:DUF3135 domain-containing protein [Pseudomonadota bacterium]
MTKPGAKQRFDFEQMSELARTDPASFEQMRSHLLDDCIARSSTAHQVRLRRLQWRVDRLREQASNPLSACVQISDLMWTTFNQLGQAYRNTGNPPAATRHSAKILPLKRR